MLNPEVVLIGRFEHKRGAMDVGGVMREIDDARACCLSGDVSDPRHLQLHLAGLLLRSSGKGLREGAE